MKSILRVLLLVAVLGVGGLAAGWFYINQKINQPVVPGELDSYRFEINEGEGVGQIVSRLEDQGLINQAWVLRAYLIVHPDRVQTVQVGEYALAPGQSMLEVMATFQHGEVQRSVTFIEGWRREEYARYLASEVSEEFAREFYTVSAEYNGKLFPDTYFIDDQTTPVELVQRMHENYQSKMQKIGLAEWLDRMEYTEDEVVTLASVLEREVADPVDQVVVAGILRRRLENGWPLEVDATIQYAMADRNYATLGLWSAILDPEFKWWPREITTADLEIDSVYNTRRQLGLPPTPISNPGLTALMAVLEPLETSYWFYLTDAEGVTRYAENLDEHHQNIQQFGVKQ